MADYESSVLTIDTTKPIIKVDYLHEGQTQKLKFTVIEHNFRKSNLKITGA